MNVTFMTCCLPNTDGKGQSISPFTLTFKILKILGGTINCMKRVCSKHVILPDCLGQPGPTCGPSSNWFQHLVPSVGVLRPVDSSYLGQGGISQSEDPIPLNPRQKEILRLKDGGNVDKKRAIEALGDGDNVLPNKAGPAPLRVLHGDIKALGAVGAGPGEREETSCPVSILRSLLSPDGQSWWQRPPS